MLQTYEGYIEKGQVFSVLPLTGIKDRCRVIITILDEPAREKPDTWDELELLDLSCTPFRRLCGEFSAMLCQRGTPILRTTSMNVPRFLA